MAFKDRLKEYRQNMNMTQLELAKASGLTARRIQHYEAGTRKPANIEIANRLAVALHASVQDLMEGPDMYVINARERGGSKAGRDIETLVSEITGLFAGGQLNEDAMDGAMEALYEAYWIAREKNKKYTPKKYRRPETNVIAG